MQTRLASSFEPENNAMRWIGAPMRTSRLMFFAVAVISGLGGYAVGNGHTTSSAIEHVSNQLGQKSAELHKLNTVVIPQLKASSHCEATRGDKAASVAGQAILSAHIDSVPTPKFVDIPADACPHPATK